MRRDDDDDQLCMMRKRCFLVCLAGSIVSVLVGRGPLRLSLSLYPASNRPNSLLCSSRFTNFLSSTGSIRRMVQRWCNSRELGCVIAFLDWQVASSELTQPTESQLWPFDRTCSRSVPHPTKKLIISAPNLPLGDAGEKALSRSHSAFEPCHGWQMNTKNLSRSTKHKILTAQSLSISWTGNMQGSTNRRAPGCVNAAGNLRQKW